MVEGVLSTGPTTSSIMYTLGSKANLCFPTMKGNFLKRINVLGHTLFIYFFMLMGVDYVKDFYDSEGA